MLKAVLLLEYLSQRWKISVVQADQTLEKTTQKLINSTIIPLLHRCQLNRMFDRKTLGGILSTETMDGKCK